MRRLRMLAPTPSPPALSPSVQLPRGAAGRVLDRTDRFVDERLA